MFCHTQIQTNTNNSNSEAMPPTTNPASHKKKKQTRKESLNRSLQSEDAKRRSSTDSWYVVTPIVTQTEGDAHDAVPDQLPPSSPLIVGPKTIINQLPLPQLANKRALSELVSGYKSNSSHYKLLILPLSQDKCDKLVLIKYPDKVNTYE
jgi:hypothetical protein